MDEAATERRRALAGADDVHVMILAGGVGSRLWPYSRRARPKQLLSVGGDDTLLQATVGRLAGAVPPERVWVLTNAEYVAMAREQLPGVPAEQIVGEPEPLGTAAAVGLGAALIGATRPDAVIAVLTADHVIAPAAAFQDALARGVEAARAGYLVTFGIRPTAPETGYGYVELGEPLPGGAPGDAGAVRAVRRFVEKPDRATAERYLADGNYAWNGGMFVWRADVIRAAIAGFLPGLGGCLNEIAALAARGADLAAALPDVWRRIPERTTIDYGVMERSERVACVPAAFAWSDVGSWDAFAALLPADEVGNRVVGRHVGLGSRGCLVFAPSGRLIATIGLEDVVVVDVGDAVLVAPLDRVQEVRAIVARLEAAGDDALL